MGKSKLPWDYRFFRNQGAAPDQALRLARAERAARCHGLDFVWSDDWSIGSHREYYGPGSAYENREPDRCEQLYVLFDDGAGGMVLASLGCIDDADYDYRRYVEAELASEALAVLSAGGTTDA